ncbi:MAG TPA: tRNA pseudouridine(38-40) synthase TruA [Terriglobales bacterium]|nr:tRNA pseudouridine(38-40) synthase TruA [Terriglobales bacterium]
MERQLLIKLSFLGGAYAGFQVQHNAPTVQGTLQQALRLLLGDEVPVTGCGRTDAGVHALEYFCTTRTVSDFAAEKLARALNANLPCDISVSEVTEVPLDFHPRYSAAWKEYQYRIWTPRHRNVFEAATSWHHPAPFDVAGVIRNAPLFEGAHDFASFMAAGSSIEDTRRTIYLCEASFSQGMLTVRVRGDGFLYNMVRIMVGTLVEGVDVAAAIAARDRSAAGPTAPACGLALAKVYYPALGGDPS